ncbi:MAG: CAP domain-containing protein [Frankiaceae bacterium]|nr:CAP domain-containing protein [Frankiaceae bacterium]
MKRTTRWVTVAAAAFALATGSTSYAGDTPTPSPTAAPSPAPAAGYSATGTWQLLALVNKTRRGMGLSALVIDNRLASAARAHTERMAASGILRHNDALFTPASHRTLGMKALGENVGWNYSVTAQHDAFLNSPGHRANIVSRSFRVAGFAVVRGADGRIWSTEDFGTPSS